jgi:hypothetical protein
MYGTRYTCICGLSAIELTNFPHSNGSIAEISLRDGTVLYCTPGITLLLFSLIETYFRCSYRNMNITSRDFSQIRLPTHVQVQPHFTELTLRRTFSGRDVTESLHSPL